MRRFPLILDVLGVAGIATGAFLFSTAVGFVAAGLGLLALSYLLERE